MFIYKITKDKINMIVNGKRMFIIIQNLYEITIKNFSTTLLEETYDNMEIFGDEKNHIIFNKNDEYGILITTQTYNDLEKIKEIKQPIVSENLSYFLWGVKNHEKWEEDRVPASLKYPVDYKHIKIATEKIIFDGGILHFYKTLVSDKEVKNESI